MRKRKNQNPFARNTRANSNGSNGAGLAEVEPELQRLPPPRGRKPGRPSELDPADVYSELGAEPGEGPPARMDRGAAAEVAAMAKMQTTLLGLDPDARQRVMQWLTAFYESIAD